ncbi:MAG: DUF1827 family protein [Vagococcus sp.]
MKLVDVTNSYATLVSKQLENTDAILVRVYSLGKTLVVHSEATTHIEVVIVNKAREIKEFEVTNILKELLDTDITNPDLEIIRTKGVVEASLKVNPTKSKVNN